MRSEITISITAKNLRQVVGPQLRCTYLGGDQGRETTTDNVAHLVWNELGQNYVEMNTAKTKVYTRALRIGHTVLHSASEQGMTDDAGGREPLAGSGWSG